ncbi:uncharacterized protein BJ171DRAFT_595132 [Polychytrium aggregatum]|uniref:uncharacterized protein n=1 Tax=Polychytrium aggregatum TaxID=110093 RepID=UPI0022FDEB8C|nr:uncharacterized protein BJ171DRAFT_595132 [Polychytrium aggregatum]KAI9209388.1 hypothetical protein BJ171DRAFT_595132 [Polychytrium aggregatum]
MLSCCGGRSKRKVQNSSLPGSSSSKSAQVIRTQPKPLVVAPIRIQSGGPTRSQTLQVHFADEVTPQKARKEPEGAAVPPKKSEPKTLPSPRPPRREVLAQGQPDSDSEQPSVSNKANESQGSAAPANLPSPQADPGTSSKPRESIGSSRVSGSSEKPQPQFGAAGPSKPKTSSEETDIRTHSTTVAASNITNITTSSNVTYVVSASGERLDTTQSGPNESRKVLRKNDSGSTVAVPFASDPPPGNRNAVPVSAFQSRPESSNESVNAPTPMLNAFSNEAANPAQGDSDGLSSLADGLLSFLALGRKPQAQVIVMKPVAAPLADNIGLLEDFDEDDDDGDDGIEVMLEAGPLAHKGHRRVFDMGDSASQLTDTSSTDAIFESSLEKRKPDEKPAAAPRSKIKPMPTKHPFAFDDED